MWNKRNIVVSLFILTLVMSLLVSCNEQASDNSGQSFLSSMSTSASMESIQNESSIHMEMIDEAPSEPVAELQGRMC